MTRIKGERKRVRDNCECEDERKASQKTTMRMEVEDKDEKVR